MDARREHLARVGMLPQHVTALAMPELGEKPILPPLRTEDLPKEFPSELEPRTLPKLPGVNVAADEPPAQE